MKKLAIIILATTLIIAGVTVGISIYANSPKTVVRNSFENLFEDLSEREEIAPFIDVFTRGSVTVDASADIGENGKVSFGGKLYFSENELYLENLHAKANDIKLDADLYVGEDYMYLTNNKILGGTYGVVYDDIVSNLKKSIFAPDSGSKLSLDEETFDQLIKMLEIYTDEKLSEMPKDLEKVYNRYTKLIIKSIEKHATYESDKGEVKVGDDFMYARTVTVTIDQKVILNVIKDLHEALEDDDDLRDLLVEYADYFEGVATKLTGTPEGEVKDFDIEKYYDEALKAMDEAIENMEESLPKFKVYVKLVTPATSAKILKLGVSVRAEGQKAELLSIDFGKDGIKKSDCIKLEIGGGVVEVKYEISENNSKEYSSAIKMNNGEKWITLIKLTINKKEDYFKITTPESLGDISIRGSFEQKGDKTTIGLSKIKIGEQTIDGFNVKITFEEKDSAGKIVAKKNIKDVTKIKEKDIEKIVENLEEFLGEMGLSSSDLSGILEGIFDGIGGIGGEAYPDELCPDCGMSLDWCICTDEEYCYYCGNPLDECTCEDEEYCYYCGNPLDECTCEYEEICLNCDRPLDECICNSEETCPECGNHIDECICYAEEACPDCGMPLSECVCEVEEYTPFNVPTSSVVYGETLDTLSFNDVSGQWKVITQEGENKGAVYSVSGMGLAVINNIDFKDASKITISADIKTLVDYQTDCGFILDYWIDPEAPSIFQWEGDYTSYMFMYMNGANTIMSKLGPVSIGIDPGWGAFEPWWNAYESYGVTYTTYDVFPDFHYDEYINLKVEYDCINEMYTIYYDSVAIETADFDARIFTNEGDNGVGIRSNGNNAYFKNINVVVE